MVDLETGSVVKQAHNSSAITPVLNISLPPSQCFALLSTPIHSPHPRTHPRTPSFPRSLLSRAPLVKEDSAAREKNESRKAASWAQGANVKGDARSAAADEKAQAAQMKRNEKAALLAAENDELDNMKLS